MTVKKSGVKKGNSSWKPASLNEFSDKEPGYTYRMVRKDQANVAKKHREGWETVSGLHDSNVKYDDPNRIEHGKSLTSMHEGHDWILMRTPDENVEERAKYYDAENARRVEGLTAHIKKEMHDKAGNAPVHGEITISSRKGTKVLD